MICIIAAIARNHAIGYKNQLLYHIADDMTRFKTLTMGHPIIMGRKTFESLPNGPLPGRRNIIISHTSKEIKGAEVFSSLNRALEECKDDDVFVIGGESIYKATIQLAHRLYITYIEDTPQEADAFFPEIGKEWKIKKDEFHPNGKTHPSYHFIDYIR